MNREVIFTEIKNVVRKYQIYDRPIELSTNLGVLGIDSITFVRVITDIEALYGIEFEDDLLDYKNIDSINVLVEYVDNQIN